jgi:hypothetical protein
VRSPLKLSGERTAGPPSENNCALWDRVVSPAPRNAGIEALPGRLGKFLRKNEIRVMLRPNRSIDPINEPAGLHCERRRSNP